jgi:hypothetical protein
MAVRVFCKSPSALLNNIKAKINDGSIDTWTVDADGDFTHSPAQWKKQAWLRPALFENRITFRIFPPKGKPVTRVIYGVFHGRFVEMLLTHFDLEFDRVTATALPADGDLVKVIE